MPGNFIFTYPFHEERYAESNFRIPTTLTAVAKSSVRLRF
jgi:hypothetical protein